MPQQRTGCGLGTRLRRLDRNGAGLNGAGRGAVTTGALQDEGQMLIKRDVLEAIKRGEITVQFRRWKRASVRPGGTLKTKVGVLSIGRIDPISVEAVAEEDCRRAGFADKAAFLHWLDGMKDGDLCRIEIGYLGERA